MPQVFKDEQGNEVEAFSQEELEIKQQEARDQAIAEAQQVLSEQEAAKADLEAELEELKRKELNNGGLRKAVGAKEKEIEDLRKKIDEVENGYKGKLAEIETKQLSEVKDTFIAGVVGNDIKAKEKIDFYYNKFAPAKTKDEMIENLKAASQLAGASIKPSSQFSSRVVSSAGGNYSIPTDGSFSGGFDDKASALEVAKKMGLTPDDFKAAGIDI